jgi:hypothetical protein
MRPTPVPDDLLWEGSTRIVVAAPGGDLTDPDIAPVEAIAEVVSGVPGLPDGTAALSIRLTPEEGDLAKLEAGGCLLLTVYGRLPVFTLTVLDENHRP